MKKHLAGMILLASVCAFAQNPYGNQQFSPVVMTATSQTSSPLPLGVSWSAGTITLVGNSLTTATFGVLVSTTDSSPGSFFARSICTVGATSTCATTQTATANGQYQLNLANATYIKFVTSGTFTGTNITLLLTASPNSLIGTSGGGGGGGGNPVTANLLAEYQYRPTETGTSATDYSGSNHPCAFGPSTQAPTRTQYGLSFTQTSLQYCDTGISMGSAQTIISYVQFPIPPNANVFPLLYGSSLAAQQLFLGTQGTQSFGLLQFFGNLTFGPINPAVPGVGVIAWVRNNSGDLLYYNGQLIATAPSGTISSNTGTLWIGSCSTSSAGYCNQSGYQGLFGFTDVYSTGLSASDVASVSNYQASQMAAKAYTPPPQVNNTTPSLAAEGDSITAGDQAGAGNTPYTNYLALNQTTNIINTGISGEFLCLMFQRQNRITALSSPIAQNNTEILWGGTNDITQTQTSAGVLLAASCYAGYVRAAKAAGFNIFVATVLDRGTLTSAIRAQFNTIVRSNWRAWGAAGVIDIAADPKLGADGASSHTSTDRTGGCAGGNFFNVDNIHPLTCAQSGNIAPEMSAALNYFYGSNQSSPTVVAANTYTVLAADGYVAWTPTSAATGTLPECIALTGRTFSITNNSASNTITMSAAGSETITGTATIAGGVTATFLDVLTGPTTGGCYWARQ